MLPDIFGLVSDTGTSFRAMRPFAGPAFMDRANALKMTEPQTVGRVATDILDTYLKSGSYFYGPPGLNGEPGFVEYWKAHAGRLTSAGWWNVRLARAGHSTLPTPRERYAAINKLRTQIDTLSEPDRTLTLLSLLDEYGADALVTSEELTHLLKQLGSDLGKWARSPRLSRDGVRLCARAQQA